MSSDTCFRDLISDCITPRSNVKDNLSTDRSSNSSLSTSRSKHDLKTVTTILYYTHCKEQYDEEMSSEECFDEVEDRGDFNESDRIACKNMDHRKKAYYDRLYDRSERRRIEGRRRRISIMKEKEAKKAQPKSHMQKISPKDAENLYYRGLKKIIEFDERVIEHAKSSNVDCQLHRFDEKSRRKVSRKQNQLYKL